MRVLHVITTIDRGGAENHLVELITGQRKQGLEVSVAYMKGKGYWREYFESIGVRVFSLKMSSYFRPSGVLSLNRALRVFHPDLLHAHMPPASLLARFVLLLPRNWRLRFLVSVHVDSPFIDTKRIEAFRGWVYSRASSVVCISQAVKKYVEKLCNTRVREKLRVIYYGIQQPDAPDPVDVRATRAEWGAGEDTLVFGTVARLTVQKGIDGLLKGFRQFRDQEKVNSRLIIIGSGVLEKSLKALCGDLGLMAEVVWIPFSERVLQQMAAMDVFVLNSTYEGFGLVLLEAMAVSRPIIGTAAGAIPEVIRDGKTGFIIPPNDPTSLAKCMVRLTDARLRTQMGQAGRDRLCSNFSRDEMVLATNAFYQEREVAFGIQK